MALRRLTDLLLGADAELKTCTAFGGGNVPYSVLATGHNMDPPPVNHLVPISAGDQHQWHRDGNLVSLQYILVRGVVSFPNQFDSLGFLSAPPVGVTVCLWMDSQTNGAQADSGLVFGNYQGSSLGNVTIQRELYNRQRFTVLRQEVFYLPVRTVFNDVNVPSYTGSLQSFEWFVPLDGLQVRYKGQSEFIIDIIDNSFHISAFSTVPVYNVITNPVHGPVLEYSVSTRYFSGPV